MNNLITAEEVKNFKDIGNKIDVQKITPIIEQAQDGDFRDYLGMNLYFSVLSNLENPLYQDLLNGCDFNFQGITYNQRGLKALLADIFMSKYILQINLNITPFGATIKSSNDSEPVSDGMLKNKAQMEREAAGSKWEIIKLYLKANKNLFPNNITVENTISTGERKLRFRKI